MSILTRLILISSRRRRYAEFEGEVATFLASEGPTLQRYLYLRSWLVRNYVSDWWEQYVYLRGRDSILINSNYYGLGLSGFVPTNVQSARAAVLVWQFLQLKRTIEREELEPMLINGTVPLCMQQ